MLSMKAKYAIRAMIYLSTRCRSTSVVVSEIAEAEFIPRKFLEAILVDLRNERLVSSRMGKKGGYTLAQPSDTISLARVIRAIDGSIAPVPCVDRLSFEPCRDCPDVKTCVVRRVMSQVFEAQQQILEQTSLADMVHLQQEIHGEPLVDFQI
jgi:Rrf2 family protein